MRLNFSFGHGKTLAVRIGLGLLALILLVVSGSRVQDSKVAHAAGNPAKPVAPQAAAIGFWTAVGSTGVVDESAAGIYAFGTSDLSYNGAGSLSTIVARYNVTNTFDNAGSPNIPGWTTLEMGSVAPAGSTVSARLLKVNPCNGALTPVCSVSNAGGGGPMCLTCGFGAPIDFSTGLYVVEVALSRNAVNAVPRLFTLRIF